MPRIPTVVPIASDATISTACTQRNPVGLPDPVDGPDQARGSSQIATPNRGQMIQVHTPTRIRNPDHFLLRRTATPLDPNFCPAKLRIRKTTDSLAHANRPGPRCGASRP